MLSTCLQVKAPTFPALLDRSVNDYKDRVFLLGHDRDFNVHTSITFKQFRNKVGKTAVHLRGEGIKKGNRVAFLCNNTESAITHLLAALSLGAVAVLANRKTPTHILSRLYESCEVTLLYVENVTESELHLVQENRITILDRASPVQDSGYGALADLEDVQPDDPSIILFTSGTTSLPKGVLHSHRTILTALETKIVALEPVLVPNGILLGLLPLYHVMGFTNSLMFCIYAGLRYAFFESEVTPELYANAVKRVGPFTFDTVPWVLEELAAMCKNDPELLAQMQKLKLISYGGARGSQRVAGFYEANKIPLIVSYGQTELGGSGLHAKVLPEDPEKWRLMKPMAGFCDSVELEPIEGVDDGGELVIKNPTTLALGYIVDGKFHPLSREAHRTGDIFGKTDSGDFFIQVRKDSVIVNLNGEKTNPLPFLSMKHNCPAIKHVCVIGNNLPHNMLFVQLTQELSLQVEQEVWNCVEATNADLTPHSRVRRHQIVFVPPSSSSLLPVSPKGDVLVREVERLFAVQISQVYKSSSFLAARYPEGFVDRIRHEPPFRQKSAVVGLIKDVLAAILGFESDQLDMEASFAEQSIRSFEAVQARNTIASILEDAGQLPVTVLFDHPSIASLADWLVQFLGLGDVSIPQQIINSEKPGEPIAIIGVGCRFAGGVKDLKSFWEVIYGGVDTVRFVPPERWDWEKYWDPNGGPGKMTCSEGAFISEIDKFDAALFGILPMEAIQMDPQHRILLETSWEAIEHSGYSPESLRGSNTGVFIGMLHHDYMNHVQKEHGDITTIDTYYGSGNSFSAACGRISYLLDLRGPCLTLDTACSSSLVALQLACQSLQSREANQCLVGGVNLMLTPHSSVYSSQAGMTGPNGRCKAFDAGANGFGRGEGCGVIMIKRLEDAIAQGDNILSVVCGVAVNHDGKTNGFTAPSRAAQEQVIESALRKAGIAPASIGLLEAHGTGTIIGDNIEMKASGTVLGRDRPTDSPLLIGAVKTNIAHTEAAAGVAGVIKATLCLQHGVVPKLNLFQTLNSNINLHQIPAIIPTENMEWNTCEGAPRYASVNSFGFSGTNAHAILKEPPKSENLLSAPSHHYFLPLSACPKTPKALDDMVQQFYSYLSSTKEHIDNICFTAQHVRSALRLRTAFVGRNKEDLLDAMQRFIHGKPDGISTPRSTSIPPQSIIIVPGESVLSGLFDVARSLYLSLPVFQIELQTVMSKSEISGVPLLSWIENGLPEILKSAHNALLTLVLNYVLLQTWKSLGVEPQVIYASGTGVYAALCSYGVISVSEAATAIQTGNETPISIKDLPLNVRIVAVDCPKPVSGTNLLHFEDLPRLVTPETVLFTVAGTEFEAQDIAQHSMVYSPKQIRHSGYMALLSVLAKLYVAGVDIKWKQFHTNLSPNLRKVEIPLYPFQRQSYWYPSFTKKQNTHLDNIQTLPYLLLKTLCPTPNTHIFSSQLSLSGDTKFFEEHKVFGNIIFPMTGFVELALEAGDTLFQGDSLSVKDFVIYEPLILQPGQNYQVQLLAAKQDSYDFSFEIYSQYLADNFESTPINKWRKHATGALERSRKSTSRILESPTTNIVEKTLFYTDQRKNGFDYGTNFQCLTAGFVDEGSSVILLQQDKENSKAIFHPALFDSCLHSMLLFFTINSPSQTHIYLPLSFENFSIRDKIPPTLSVQFIPTKSFTSEAETLSGNIFIFNKEGDCVAEMTGINTKRTSKIELHANLERANSQKPDLFYNLTWQPSPLNDDTDLPVGNTLIFTDKDTHSQKIAAHIKNSVAQSTKVMVADVTHSSLAKILEGPFWENTHPAHILLITVASASISNEESLFSQFQSLMSTFLLTQNVISFKFKVTPRLWLVTRNATWVGGEQLNLLSSPIWGFGASVCMEHPELSCKRIDLDSDEACGELLLRELQQNDQEDQVGFRNGIRHVMRFTNSRPTGEDTYTCDPNASYLVTGGFGGIGLESIGMLVSLGARHIVVISRSGKIPAEKAHVLEQWQTAGVVIEAQAADMADYNRLKEILANVKYPLKGILHSAGIADDTSLRNTNWDKFESVFGPKVCGSWYLHQLTKDLNLDFFVLYSSIAASLGNAGQCNYSAANYFMDALAHYRRAVGLPGLSINWGVWADVGIAAQRNLTTALKKKGLHAFPSDVGIEALQKLLVNSPSDSISVVWVNWELYFKQFSAVPLLFSNITKGQHKTNKSHSVVLSKLQQAKDFDAALFDYIKQEISAIVGLPSGQIDADRALTELGVDSLVATQLRNNFSNALSISLPASMAFEYPSLTLIWEYVKPLVSQKLKEEASNKIPQREKQITTPKSFGLNLAQKGLWWMWNLAPESIAYNVANFFKFRLGDLDIGLLRACWNELGDSYDIMRTIFVVDPGTGLPTHEIRDNISNPFATFEVTDDSGLRVAMEKEYQIPFNLSAGPLYRFAVFSCGDIHVVLIIAHHIVTDAATEIFLIEDLFKLYKLRKSGVSEKLSPGTHYSDLVSHSEQQLKDNGERLWQYWKTHLSGGIPYLDFKFAQKKQIDPSKPVGASYNFYLGSELLAQIKNAAKSLRVTVYHILLTGFLLLLSKYTNQKEVVIASFVDSRSKADYERLLGFCVETILVKGDFSEDPTLSDSLAQVSKAVLQATKELYPFPALIEKLERVHGKSRVQVAFNFLQNVGDALEGKSKYMPPLEPVTVIISQQDGQFDLALEIDGTKDLFSVFKYNPQIFHAEQIEKLAIHLGILLENMCHKLSTPLSKIGFITEAEHDLVVNKWNESDRDYPYLTTRVYDLIERQMHKNPQNIAVQFREESITYALLERQVAELADVLVSLGVGPNITCGVCVERSPYLLVAVLAIFKVGGTYLPLAHDYPAARIQLMIQDSRTLVLLTTGPIFSQFLSAGDGMDDLKNQLGDKVVFLDNPVPKITASQASRSQPGPEDIAYIIYTSGSTGTPKGVLIPYRGFSNVLLYMLDEYKLQSTDKVLLKSSIGFDMSFTEIFWPLVNGATVVVAEQGGQVDPYYLLELIQQAKVTAAVFVPGHIQALFSNPSFDQFTSSVHTFVIAGEAVPLSLYPKLGRKIRNCYGPSEGTIWALELFCEAVNLNEKPYDVCRTIPVGKPIANSKIYILDSYMNPVTAGVAGELYISGVNVGLGYLNNPELTQQKFLPDPFHPPWKMYKTGDLGVYLPSGDIEILGRVDHQVKIRGFRIELGEVDAALLRHAQVKEAVAIVVEDGDNKLLVAYITLYAPLEVEETDNLIAELKQFLSSFLPAHMVPLRFMILKEFPLTSSGKINRSALPSPIFVREGESQPQPIQTKLEAISIVETLRSMWDQLNVRTNSTLQTFTDAGGSSLLAMQFLNKFQAVFNKKLPVAVFMKNPTIDGIAKYLTSKLPHPMNTVPLQNSLPNCSNVDIAIVGMSCRYPGSDSISQFWRSLVEGKDGIEQAILIDSNGDRFPCSAGFISELEKFDPKLFRISPREASVMDPQQRLLLEVTWEALENAAIPPNSLKNSLTGVFIGAPPSGYFNLIREHGEMKSQFAHIPTGNFPSVTSGRIAHAFGLKGPAITIDTACSSSLVAIHQACKSLIGRETNISIAGGVNILVHSELFYFMDKLGIQGDRCRTFDAKAQGYARSEGCGVVVLKRLDDAIQSKDPIVAVIKGSAINQDGPTTSISTPSSDAQVAVIEEALRTAQLAPNDITFLEAHGTGTPLGDPIEMEAIIQALCSTKRKTPLIVGSIKTNIGHAEAAAGVSGLMKVALSLQKNIIPQHIHLENLNPNMPSLEGKVVIPHAASQSCPGSHYAGVSSFGFSGTNAHIILATAPASETVSNVSSPTRTYIVPISARTATSLRKNVERLKELMQTSSPIDLSSVSYTYMVGRAHLEHRLSLVGTKAEIEAGLDNYLAQKEEISAKFDTHSKHFFKFQGSATAKLEFVFSEEDYILRDKLVNLLESDAALDKFATETVGDDPIFKQSFLECTSIYGDYKPSLVTGELALFAFQYSLAKTWQKWGLEPSKCVGFGVGEFAASCVSGALSLRDTISILLARHKIIANESSLKSYTELIVYAKEHLVQELLLDSPAKIVSVSGLDRVVVAGDSITLRKLEFTLRASNIKSRFVDHPRVQSLIHFVGATSRQEYEEFVTNVRVLSPVIPMAPTHPRILRLETEVIRIQEATKVFDNEGPLALLEINFSSVTSALLQRLHRSSHGTTVLPSCRHGGISVSLHHVLAKLYALGVAVDWNSYTKSSPRYENAQKIVLPTYAFDHITCWFNDKPFRVVGAGAIRDFESANSENKVSKAHTGRAISSQKRLTNSIPLQKLDVPRPTFQTELQLLPYQSEDGLFVTPTTQIIGLIVQALEQHNSKAFSTENSPNLQITFEPPEITRFHTARHTVNVELSPKREKTQFCVFLREIREDLNQKEEKSWVMLASGTAKKSTAVTELSGPSQDTPIHIATHFAYIKSLNVSQERTKICAKISIEADLTTHSVAQSALRCCEDIVQTIHDDAQHFAKVVHVSALKIHTTKLQNVMVHITVTHSQKEDIREDLTIDVSFVDEVSNTLLVSISGVVVGFFKKVNTDVQENFAYSNWTATETAIADMWRHELMLPNLDIDDSFAELGGDSIFGAILCTQIERTFQVKIDVNALLSAATVRKLAKLVDSQLQIGNGAQISEKGSSELVLMQQGKSGHPIFLVHPIGGTVSIYKSFIQRLGDTYTVYGLQAHGVHLGETPLDDVTDMATNYIKCIRSVQPHGPYQIGGSSFGGIVAYEMGLQLLEKGEKIDFLALFDSPCPPIPYLSEDEIFERSLQYILREQITLPNELRGTKLVQKLEYIRTIGKLPKSLDIQALTQIVLVWVANHTALMKYTPRFYPGTVHLLKATEKNDLYPWVDVDAWKAKKVTVVEVPGDHVSMFVDPNAGEVAEKFLAILNL